MKQLSCEMCGSTDVVKQEGLFVCQTCGTKYSVEEARKMMTGETVEVEGTVKIDQSEELKNLYEIARRAKDSNNSENALKYYDQILVKDPNSWEAQFYVVYFRAMGCKIFEIPSAAELLTNSFDSVLSLIKNNVSESEQEKIVDEVVNKSINIYSMLFLASKNHYNDIDISIRRDYLDEHLITPVNVREGYIALRNNLLNHFGDKYGEQIIKIFQEEIAILNYLQVYKSYLGLNKKQINAEIEAILVEIRKIDPNFETEEEKRNRIKAEEKERKRKLKAEKKEKRKSKLKGLFG